MKPGLKVEGKSNLEHRTSNSSRLEDIALCLPSYAAFFPNSTSTAVSPYKSQTVTPGRQPIETPMVHATIRMLIPPKRRGEVMEILSSIAERSRFEEGCINSRVYQDVDSEPAFMVDQLWARIEDLERHLRSEEFHKMLLVLEMSLEPPEVRFEEISGSTGVKTIEKARSSLPGRDRF